MRGSLRGYGRNFRKRAGSRAPRITNRRRILRLATDSQSVISRVTEVGSKFRNALLLYGFLDRSHSEDLLHENEFWSPYYTYYRSMVLDTNLNLYDGASAQGLSVLRYFE